MSKNRYVRGKDGKFKGSVGDGKLSVPTAQHGAGERSNERDTDTPSDNISDTYSKFLQVLAKSENAKDMSDDDVLVLFRLSRGTSGDEGRDDLAGWTAIASHLTDEQQAFLADHTSLGCRRDIASQTTTPPLVLEGMTGDDWYLRELVAGNPSTSAEVLEMLSEYEDDDGYTPEAYQIIYAVGRNPSTPAHVLTRLACDHEDWYREGVAENPSAPAEALDNLARSGSTAAGLKVVRNPNTSIETLTYLATNSNEELGYRSQKELESRLAAQAKQAAADSDSEQGR